MLVDAPLADQVSARTPDGPVNAIDVASLGEWSSGTKAGSEWGGGLLHAKRGRAGGRCHAWWPLTRSVTPEVRVRVPSLPYLFAGSSAQPAGPGSAGRRSGRHLQLRQESTHPLGHHLVALLLVEAERDFGLGRRLGRPAGKSQHLGEPAPRGSTLVRVVSGVDEST